MQVKVQAVDTPKGERWLLVDSSFAPVTEVNAFLGSLDARRRSPNTIRTYAYSLVRYCRYLEERGLGVADLGTSKATQPIVLLSDFMSSLQFQDLSADGNVLRVDFSLPRISDARVNNIMTAVMGLYRYLAEAKVVSPQLDGLYRELRFDGGFQSFLSELTGRKRPVSSVLKIRLGKQVPKYVTREGYERVIACCRTLRDKLLTALMFECGLRVGEALGVRLEDLDEVECGKLKVVPREDNENGARVKYGAAGDVYLPDYVVRLLVAYLEGEAAQHGSDYLFVSLKGPTAGSPMRADSALKLYRRISAATGVKVHPHMFRHGFAVEKLEAGWQEEEISLYLRHSSLRSTRIYEHFTERLAEERLRPFISAPPPALLGL